MEAKTTPAPIEKIIKSVHLQLTSNRKPHYMDVYLVGTIYEKGHIGLWPAKLLI